MSALNEAFSLFNELQIGTHLVALNGFDSNLIAVVSNHGINLYQDYGDNTAVNSVFLPEECYKGLIKLLQEKVNVTNNTKD